MDKEDVWYTHTHTHTYVYIYIHTMEYILSHKKEWNHAMCSNMDGPRDHDYHTKWSKSNRKRQASYDITCIWNLEKKMIQRNLFTKQK